MLQFCPWEALGMAPNPKKNMPTFRQHTLMISSRSKLSTQALENVEKARAASRRSCSSSAGSNSSASATAGSSSCNVGVGTHVSDPVVASTAISEPSSTNCESGAAAPTGIVDLTKDTAIGLDYHCLGVCCMFPYASCP
jgi:hypothetical protein